MSARDAAATSTADDLLNWHLLDDPALLGRCREALRDEGIMVIRNFATRRGLDRIKDEVLSCPYNDSKQHYTPWQDQGDERYPPSHPRNYKSHSSAAFVGRKSLERTRRRSCVSIYDDDRLTRFLSRAATKRLHRSTDANGSVYSYRIERRHSPPWHFDESPYTAILYLQRSDGGGEFEYVPWCRTTRSKDDAKGHEVVKRILMRDNRDDVRRMDSEPSSLIFFSGAHSFHRAAPVRGLSARLGLVFTYGLEEGFVNSDSVQQSNEWDPADATCLRKQEEGVGNDLTSHT